MLDRFSSTQMGRMVACLYFFSGTAALAYQVLWARMLSMQFGVSIFGVVITAAAFMVGLGLGALWGGRWRQHNIIPLRLFAMLEASVAIYALLLPMLLQLLDSSVSTLAPESLMLWYGMQLLAALILIAIPAIALGVGFPMVLKSIESTPVSLAWVYGLNTFGGALGALLPLWLLPAIGWSNAVWVVACVGLLVAFFAWGLSRKSEAVVSDTSTREIAAKIELKTVLAYACVGAAALMLEIGWTRLFGMLLLRTEYVMAVILAVFLVGVGGGSLLARHMMSKWWFDVLPVAAAVFGLLSLWGMPALAAWAEQAEFSSLATAMLMQGLAIALLTLPVTLLLGAWLPLLSARFSQSKVMGARLYGANALGAAIGALVAGFVLIPWLGTPGAIVFAVSVLFVAGMTWAQNRTWMALPLLVILAWPVTRLPAVHDLLPMGQKNSHDVMVHEDVLAITHVVEREDGQRLLLADLQRMDASSEPLAVISQQNQVRLPLLLHPEPKTVLFLGLGTGISASGSLPWTQLERTAVELSQGAIAAAEEWFRPVNNAVTDPAEGKMTVVRDDARRYLKTTMSHYDVIVGDLFHPDLVGRSALLSVQQFTRARARLNQGGLFVQWLALNQFDPESLRVVMRSFQQVFPEAVLFIDGFRLALVGGNGWHPTAEAMQANLDRLDEAGREQATGTEGAWSWLGRYWGDIRLGDGVVQDEWAPVIEYQLPRARYRGEMDVIALIEWLLQQRPHQEQAQQALLVKPADAESFERAYVATELALRAWVAELKGDSRQGQNLLRLAYQANPNDRWISGTIADRMYMGLGRMVAAQELDRHKALESILRLRPDHADALRDMWQLEAAEGSAELAEHYRQRFQQLSPLDRSLVQ